MSIVSDCDAWFILGSWESLQESMGNSLKMSTAFHPQIEGQTERTNQVMEDILRVCAIDFGSSWEMHLSLVEFVYNNSYHSSIGMVPFEALYRRPC